MTNYTNNNTLINDTNNNNTVVYIMIDTDTRRQVVVAKDYQQIALNNYIELGLTEPIEFGTDTEICFHIGIFNSVKKGLSGEYSDVYEYIKDNNTIFLISKNYEKLSSLCGFLNRVIDYQI